MRRALCIITTFFLLLSAGTAAARTIILAADEWPPFNTHPGARLEGYMVDVAREVFEPLGITVAYKVMPWVRAVEGVLRGEYDALVGATPSESDGLVRPAEPLGVDQLALYVRRDDPWRFGGLASLEDRRLGAVEGYDYVPDMSRYIAANRRNPARIHLHSGTAPLERLIGMLLLGRIDVLLDTEASIRFVAAEMGVLDALQPAGQIEGAEKLLIAFSPAKPDASALAASLTDGIRRLRASGRLQEILERYGMTDWAPAAAPQSLQTSPAAPGALTTFRRRACTAETGAGPDPIPVGENPQREEPRHDG